MRWSHREEKVSTEDFLAITNQNPFSFDPDDGYWSWKFNWIKSKKIKKLFVSFIGDKFPQLAWETSINYSIYHNTHFCGSFGSFRFFAAALTLALPGPDVFLATALTFFPLSFSFTVVSPAAPPLTNGSDDGCWKAFWKWGGMLKALKIVEQGLHTFALSAKWFGNFVFCIDRRKERETTTSWVASWRGIPI